MTDIEKVIDAIAGDLCMLYEPPVQDNMWFTSPKAVRDHCRNVWKDYLMKIAEKAVERT